MAWRVELADRLLDDLGHCRLAVDAAQMRDRHLPGRNPLICTRDLQLVEPVGQPYAELGRRNRHRQFALQALGKGLVHLHGIFSRSALLSRSARRSGCSASRAGWCGRRDLNPHGRAHRNLNPACLPIPPRPPGTADGAATSDTRSYSMASGGASTSRGLRANVRWAGPTGAMRQMRRSPMSTSALTAAKPIMASGTCVMSSGPIFPPIPIRAKRHRQSQHGQGPKHCSSPPSAAEIWILLTATRAETILPTG